MCTVTEGTAKTAMDASPDEIDRMVRQMAAKRGDHNVLLHDDDTDIMKISKKPWCRSKKQPKRTRSSRESTWRDRLSQSTIKGAQDASYIKKPDENALAHWNAVERTAVSVLSHMLPEEADGGF